MNLSNAFSFKDDSKYIADKINECVSGKWRIMEVCGGQTNSIIKLNLESLLPKNIELIHGPGCPVCVTAASIIDKAILLSRQDNVILFTFGDMMHVPASDGNTLFEERSVRGNIKIAYSPIEAIKAATEMPYSEIVILAVGFETTAPIYALTILEAERRNIRNLSLLTSIFAIPEAISSIAGNSASKIDGILAAGHVCSITGEKEYENLSATLNKPIVITGFDSTDIMFGIYVCTKMLEAGENKVFNAYRRAVKREGNGKALKDMFTVFEKADGEWRGIGIIKNSGLRLKKKYEHYNASRRFAIETESKINDVCRAGDIMTGKIEVCECPFFAGECTPEHPIGAAMVSSEGVCGILYKYNIRYRNKRVI